MTFEANDAGAGVDALARGILSWDQFGEAAPSLAIAPGEDAA